MDISFLQMENTNGAYGIDSLRKIIEAANRTYDLFAAVYLDDRKFGGDDFGDLITYGPSVITAVIDAAKGASQADEELLDLSEAEKSVLLIDAGERLRNPAYIKILKGMLEMADGIGELINGENPVD